MSVKPSVERGIGEKRRNEVGENKELDVVDAEEVDDGRRIRRNGFNVVVRAMLRSENESVHVDPLSADQWESLCQKQSPPVDPQEGLPKSTFVMEVLSRSVQDRRLRRWNDSA